VKRFSKVDFAIGRNDRYMKAHSLGRFCNLVRTMLAISLANNAFNDYSTMDQCLEFEPPDEEMYYVQWMEGVLDKSSFRKAGICEIQTAGLFISRLRAFGLRA
jgi:hypothetical protein